jgi:hypothetical protein
VGRKEGPEAPAVGVVDGLAGPLVQAASNRPEAVTARNQRIRTAIGNCMGRGRGWRVGPSRKMKHGINGAETLG